jgi:dihydrofolate reductase
MYRMGKIIYTVLASIDGYFEDVNGNFDWAQPTETIHKYINEFEKLTSLFICGRKMYDVMKIWENFPDIQKMPDYIIEYAEIWKNYNKIVYSAFEKGNIGIGGANLASQFLSLKLIDEIHIFTFPILIGSGKMLISTNNKIELRKYESRDFENGIVLSKYIVKN